jgi:hypothetical protein
VERSFAETDESAAAAAAPRAVAAGGAERLLGLQRSAGNRAVRRLLAREPQSAYETRSLEIEGVEADAARHYWEQRAFGRYDVTFVGTQPRDEERDAVLSVLMNTPVPNLRRGAVTIERHVPARAGVTGSRALNLTFTFSRPRGAARVAVDVEVNAGAPAAGATTVDPPAGYATRDMGDFRIEEAERATGRTLTVTGLDTIPADERVRVKIEVASHFQTGRRDTEVDAIVTLTRPGTDPLATPVLRRIFYTFRFQPAGRRATTVSVERIGEDDAAARARVGPRDLEVQRVRGFPAQGTADQVLAWCRTRYPGVTLQLPAVPSGAAQPSDAQRRQQIINAINAVLRSEAGTPDWFLRNYDISVLDAAAGETRLTGVHSYATEQVASVKAFTEDELRTLEFSLQSMSEHTLSGLRGVRMVRQSQAIVRTGRRRYAPRVSQSGLTIWTGGGDVTVLIFDRALAADNLLFLGGTRGTRPASTMTFAHELGHVVGEARGGGATERAFERFVATLPRATRNALRARFTWYAATSPGRELFPEAFALFHQDPEWMERNWPEVFAWFTMLSDTGAPPPAPAPARRRR